MSSFNSNPNLSCTIHNLASINWSHVRVAEGVPTRSRDKWETARRVRFPLFALQRQAILKKGKIIIVNRLRTATNNF